MRIYSSAEELIGKTPLLRLKRIEKKYSLKAEIIAKLEYLNPAGSAKDRVAKAMLDDAESRGIISDGAVIIEPTSGNTGIGLASVAASRGYKTVIVMPDSMSEERRTILRAYGAELVLTPASLGMMGCIEKANELAKEIPNSFIPGQFDNPANSRAHELTTGPVTGVGRYLKSKNSNIRIIAVEPSASPLLSCGKAAPHGIQGIGANFIPSVLDRTVYDEILTVSDENALLVGREVGRTEGILVGISSGAALSAAIELARRPENEGKRIVVLLPDTGDRYLSTALFK